MACAGLQAGVQTVRVLESQNVNLAPRRPVPALGLIQIVEAEACQKDIDLQVHSSLLVFIRDRLAV